MQLTPPTLPDLKEIGTSKLNEIKYLFTRNIDKLTSIDYASQIQTYISGLVGEASSKITNLTDKINNAGLIIPKITVPPYPI